MTHGIKVRGRNDAWPAYQNNCPKSSQTARLTGTFKTAGSPEQTEQTAKEKQLARQVELNLALKRVQAQLAAARQQL